MVFFKINGAGNDFIVFNNMKKQIPEEKLSPLTKKLCERHLSIGADGVMFMEEAANADITMRIFNADGSEAETCGNGMRCAARYAWEEKLAGNPIRMQVKAGYVEIERLSQREYRVRLQDISHMGSETRVTVNGREYSYTYVEIGNPSVPHIVVPLKGMSKIDREILFRDGQSLRYHSNFPKGANVNYCEVTGDNTADVLTYERGVEAFTYACGTGSASVAAVLRLQNIVKSDTVTLKVPGGLLKVELVRKNKDSSSFNDIELYQTGDTNIVCRGEVLDEDYVF